MFRESADGCLKCFVTVEAVDQWFIFDSRKSFAFVLQACCHESQSFTLRRNNEAFFFNLERTCLLVLKHINEGWLLMKGGSVVPCSTVH